MWKNEITWDGSNTVDVVNFCVRNGQSGKFSNLCHCISFSKNGKDIAFGNLVILERKLYDHSKKIYKEIPTNADLLCIEATDATIGLDFHIRIGETVESYDDKFGHPFIRIKKEPPDA